MKLQCNYMGVLLGALRFSQEKSPECLASLLEALEYLDTLPQWESVVEVHLGPDIYPSLMPSLTWAGYRAEAEPGEKFLDRQVIHGGLNYSRASGLWSVNT